MKESFDEAVQELKRVDHLFWVSLKYTRTVDVIKHVIDRLINCIGFGIEALLKYAKEKKLVANIPANQGLRCDLLRKTFPDNAELIDYINFYMRLRKLSKAEYTKREEFRRHVTMTAITDSGIVNITLDVIKEYYDRTTDYIDYVDNLLNPKKE